MKILFVYLRYEGDIYMDSYEQDHLGIEYMTSVLRNNGYDVQMINAHFLGLSLEELIEKIEPLEFDLLCVPIHVETLFDMVRLTQWVSEHKKAKICVGGHWAGTEPKKIFTLIPQIDFIITGEGEYTILDLVNKINSGDEFNDVKGLAWKDNDKIVVNAPRCLIEDLDELPYPARDSIEIYNTPEWDYKKRTANILASRGCYANCSFCSIKSFYNASKGKKIRFRDPKKIVDEIEYLQKNYRVNQIFFSDDNFRAPDKINPLWTTEIANEIIKRGIKINFIMLSRVDDVDLELYSLLKKAGLVGVALGIESDVKRMLDTYNKKTTPESNRKALEILRKLRLDPLISFMMFDPYTTIEELEKNLMFFREINYTRYYHYTRPLTLLAGYDLKTYGGTPLTLTVENDGLKQESKYSYECEYRVPEVAEVFDMLQRWRPSILKTVMHNPLWLIDIAKRLGEIDILYRIHALSRKYIKLDAALFDQFVEYAKRGIKSHSKEIDELLEENKSKLRIIEKELSEIEDGLEEIRKSKSCNSVREES